jgi:hypothetical protein
MVEEKSATLTEQEELLDDANSITKIQNKLVLFLLLYFFH